jgi:hypothetical protein
LKKLNISKINYQRNLSSNMSHFEVVDFVAYNLNDPVWAVTIHRFLTEYPEFQQYINFVPMHSVETIPYNNVNTLFEAVMHYICASGVRYSYACKQWEIIYPLIGNSNDWNSILNNVDAIKFNHAIQPKKREVYNELCKYMNENGLTHTNITVSNLKVISKNVNGIGVGCVAWCNKYFTNDDDCIEYTDINFKKGFIKIYNTDKLSDRKKKSEEWRSKGLGRIASLFVQNINNDN